MIRAFLAASLLANAAFATMVWSHWDPVPADDALQTDMRSERVESVQQFELTSQAEPRPSELRDDLVRYREKQKELDRLGVTLEIARKILIAAVNKEYREKIRGVLPRREPFRFWQSEPDTPYAARITELALIEAQRLRREQLQLLGELFSDVYNGSLQDLVRHDYVPGEDSSLAYLPPERRLLLIEAKERWNLQMVKDYPAHELDHGYLSTKRLEWEAQVSALLTSQELERYLMDASDTSRTLRNGLDGFDPSEREFRDIFRLQKAFDDEWATTWGTDAESLARHATATEQLQQSISETLGERRYKDYRRTKDDVYQHLALLSETFQLDGSVARNAYDKIRPLIDQLEDLHKNRTLSRPEQLTRIAKAHAAAKHEVVEAFGEGVFADLEHQRSMRWLSALGPAYLAADAPECIP